MNKLPLRANQHLTEDISVKVFTSTISSNWIIRQPSGRDYGFDMLVEYVADNSVTGKMAGIQLKATQKITSPLTNNFTIYNIKSSTTNYWLSSNIPAFIFLVTANNAMYFLNIKNYLRKNYSGYMAGSNFSYTFTENDIFTNEDFYRHFEFEINNSLFEQLVQNIPSIHEKLSDVFKEKYHRDFHMPVDDEKAISDVSRIRNNILDISKHLKISTNIADFNELISQANISDRELCEYHLSKMLDLLDDQLNTIIKTISQSIKCQCRSYWLEKDESLVEFIDSYNDETFQKRYWRLLQESRQG